MTRKAKLEKALAFDGTILPYKHFPMFVIGEGEQFALINEYVNHGMKLSSLAQLHAALIEAIGMLELLGCEKAKLGNSFTRYKSRKALAKIDDALDSLQLGPDCKPTRDESGT